MRISDIMFPTSSEVKWEAGTSISIKDKVQDIDLTRVFSIWAIKVPSGVVDVYNFLLHNGPDIFLTGFYFYVGIGSNSYIDLDFGSYKELADFILTRRGGDNAYVYQYGYIDRSMAISDVYSMNTFMSVLSGRSNYRSVDTAYDTRWSNIGTFLEDLYNKAWNFNNGINLDYSKNTLWFPRNKKSFYGGFKGDIVISKSGNRMVFDLVKEAYAEPSLTTYSGSNYFYAGLNLYDQTYTISDSLTHNPGFYKNYSHVRVYPLTDGVNNSMYIKPHGVDVFRISASEGDLYAMVETSTGYKYVKPVTSSCTMNPINSRYSHVFYFNDIAHKPGDKAYIFIKNGYNVSNLYPLFEVHFPFKVTELKV